MFEEPGLAPLNLPEADLALWKSWLPAAEAQSLYLDLLDTVPWSQPELRMGGRSVKIPRLQAWFGDSEALYAYSRQSFQPMPWTPPLQVLREALAQICSTEFNSVLINLYRDGNDSVSWHGDNERELGKQPVVASVSLGATRKFQLKPSKAHSQPRLPMVALDVDHGDLLVMAGQTQQRWLHCIPKTSKPVGARINLTFRRIKHGGD